MYMLIMKKEGFVLYKKLKFVVFLKLIVNVMTLFKHNGDP